MGKYPVFFIERTNRSKVSLRRYRSSLKDKCSGPHGFCNAQLDIGETADEASVIKPDQSDPRWPQKCEGCGSPFGESDEYQVFFDAIYVGKDGKEYSLRNLPVGACYDASWLAAYPKWRGPDGRSLHVVCPGGSTWCIDSKASNCTMREDWEHRCWVRHGSPEEGNLHVDKNGKTCNAGAGSIQTTNWHGFLKNGHLSEEG